MKPRTAAVTILIFLLIDEICMFFFPMDYRYIGYSFMPHFAYLTLVMVLFKADLLSAALSGMLCGLVTDYFVTESFPLYTILYLLTGLFVGWLSSHLKDNRWVRFFLGLFLLMLIDWIPFCLYSMQDGVRVSFSAWFMHHQLITLIVNSLFIFFLQYMFGVMERYNTIREHRISARERKQYRRLRVLKK